jgi:predicted RNA-binding protein YlqC (UPF0109 family)
MSLTIDQQFVEFIVKSLVGDPDKVEIKRTIDEKGVLLELTVAQDDLGRVIGKRGATAQSIRTLLRALGTKNEARYNLKIVDPEGGPRPPRDDAPVSEDSSSSDDSTSDDSSVVVDEPVDKTPVVADEPADVEEASDDDDEDSMVARHRRDLEDFDDDEL